MITPVSLMNNAIASASARTEQDDQRAAAARDEAEPSSAKSAI
jgi:hypothetical protein